MKHLAYIIEYFILFAINLVMLWFFRGYLNLIIAILMVLFLCFSVASVHFLKKHVSIKVSMPPGELPKNTDIYATISVSNDSFLFAMSAQVKVRIGNEFMGGVSEHKLSIPIRPKGTTKLSYPISSAYVGDLSINVSELVINDLLSMHTVDVDIDETARAYIFPGGILEEEFDINAFEAGMDEVEESNLKGNDFSDVGEIREYIPGDSIKNIHWKLSAKKDDLMVKDRLRMSSGKLNVLLKVDRGNPEVADETMERMYGFCKNVIEKNTPLTIFWWSDKFNDLMISDVDSVYDLDQVTSQMFTKLASDGDIVYSFMAMHPGKSGILIDGDGIKTEY